MRVSKIKLHNFRSYELFETEFSENGNVIIGPNGIGKTNLLEAVYLTLRGSSFRGPLSNCIRIGTNQTNIVLEMPKETRRLQLTTAGDKLSRQWTINDHKSKILSYKNRAPVVLFEPNELRLITSSPTRRRDFLDSLIAKLDIGFDRTLRAFQRTLLQRNELLKNHDTSSTWHDHLFAWDIKFVELASIVAQTRASFLFEHEAQLKNLYISLAGKSTELSVEYLPSTSLENYHQSLISRLNRSLDYEIATGHTSCGPQREDYLIYLHNQPAVNVASRGEMRTIMLAFKLLELELLTKETNEQPIILLDDVFSELDQTRAQLLQETIKDHQFILTTTDSDSTKNKYKIIPIN